MADTDPVDPFGASVPAVIALLPHATFPDTLAVGQRAVTQAMIRQYIEDVTGTVELRLQGWTRLHEDRKELVSPAARSVVHAGAAAYTQDARFPEKSGKTRDSYAEVLWQRYSEGLDRLEQQVKSWLGDEAASSEDAGGAGIAGVFPAPRASEQMRF